MILMQKTRLITFCSIDPLKTKPYFETFTENIKTVVCEKFELENCKNLLGQIFFWENLDNRELDSWIKTNGLMINLSSKSMKFLNQSRIEDIKPVAS